MHALRHYYAPALLEAGVSIRAVSEYLGHADPGFTLRICAHLMPSSDERARQAMDLALRPEPQIPRPSCRVSPLTWSQVAPPLSRQNSGPAEPRPRALRSQDHADLVRTDHRKLLQKPRSAVSALSYDT